MSFVSRIREFFFSPKTTKKEQPIHVVADLATSVFGEGSSLSPYVKTCRDILKKYNLHPHPHATGTNIEGDLSNVSKALRECHKRLHQQGIKRVSTTLTINSRVDKDQSIKSIMSA